MALEALVYDATNTTLIGPLPLSLRREWRDELMGVGFGSVTVPVGSDDDLRLISDRVVRFRLDGVDRYAIICSNGDQVLAEDLEESGHLTSWSGPGLLQWFDESVVYPELGLGRLSPSDRVFNFASTSFDDSGWGSAVQIKQQTNIDSFPWADAPDDWPDEDAWWIWSSAMDPGLFMPEGTSFFRKTFTVTDQTDAILAVSCDDGYEVWIDGEKVAEEGRAFLWGRTTEYGMLLDAGDHLIAVKAYNVQRDGPPLGNVAGFIASILAVSQGGQVVDSILVRTDNSWLALDYPDPWPTMTPGEIMNVLLDEAQAVGELTWVSRGFTDALDANGVGWWNTVDISIPVGSTLLDVLLALREAGTEFEMDYGSNTLRLYNRDGMGVDRTDLNFVTLLDDPEPGDWVHLTLVSERAIAKRALTQLDNEVWTLVDSFAGVRHTTGFARLGTATSTMQAERVMEGWFDQHAYGRVDFAGQLNPTPGKLPYVDFGLADRIMVPGWYNLPTGATKAIVTTIAVSELAVDDDGEIDGTQLLAIEGRFVL